MDDSRSLIFIAIFISRLRNKHCFLIYFYVTILIFYLIQVLAIV
jgi:hypothetical protein